jgi:hypothetical protein
MLVFELFSAGVDDCSYQSLDACEAVLLAHVRRQPTTFVTSVCFIYSPTGRRASRRSQLEKCGIGLCCVERVEFVHVGTGLIADGLLNVLAHHNLESAIIRQKVQVTWRQHRSDRLFLCPFAQVK